MGDYPVGRSLTGEDRQGKIRDAHVHAFKLAGGHTHQALVVQTHPLVETEPSTKFFFNPDFGINMNQNVSFSGTTERIHNGTDSSLYTFSEPVGNKAIANSTDRANEAIATIVNYSIIDSGDKITIDGTDLVAGGTDWTASVNNSTTATSLAAAVSAISGGAYTGSAHAVSGGNYDVSILRTDGNSLSTLTTNADAGEMVITTLKAVKVANMGSNNVMQFAKGSDLVLANFTAITLWINVDKNWSDADSVAFVAFDTGLNIEIGNRIFLEDYFTFGDFDTWQSIVIPLTDMGISVATTVDAFRFIQAERSSPAPTYYIDKLQIEGSGTPISFTISINDDQRFHIEELVFSFADVLNTTLSTNSMPVLSYDKILGLPRLNNGFTITRSKEAKVLFVATIKSLGDHMAAGAKADDPWSDGTNTFIVLRVVFDRPLILTGDVGDNITIQINDDMSGLLQFRVAARGGLET